MSKVEDNPGELIVFLNELFQKGPLITISDEDVDIISDPNFHLRFSCMQGWFLRCSYLTKLYFLKQLAYCFVDINTLINMLHILYMGICKDRKYSVINGGMCISDAKLSILDNRSLDNETLKKVITNELDWFLTLTSNEQFTLVSNLIELADSSCIMGNVFEQFLEVFKDRIKTNKIFKQSQLFSDSINKTYNSLQTTSDKTADCMQYLNQNIPQDDPKHPLIIGVNQAYNKWDQLMMQYRTTLGYVPPSEVAKSRKSSAKKSVRNSRKISLSDKGIPDKIQYFPIWVTCGILSLLEPKEQNVLKNLNNYWKYAMKELNADINSRKYLNKIMDQIKGSFEDKPIKVITKPGKATYSKQIDYTKPPLRKKLKLQTETNRERLKNIFKGDKIDLTQYTKKLEMFPRPNI